MNPRAWLFVLLQCILAWAVVPARAEPVAQEYLGLEVGGNLEIAPARSLAKDGVILIVHGSAAHHRLDVIEALQRNLAARGLNSLAITLSLGLPKRTGMFDCGLEHDHRHADAADEIIAWVEWLQKKGANRVTLLGHSRGGGQAALAVVERSDAGVAGLVLAAPLWQTEAEIAVRYATDSGQPLEPLLAKARQLSEAGEGDTLLQVPSFLHCKPAKVTAAAFLDYYAPDPQFDVLKLIPETGVRALLVLAGGDRITPGLAGAVTAARRAGRLPPPDRLTTITVDDADHFFRDLFGEDLADHVATFVGGK
jgi:pimeloyl-ACP methyl ester carboxylesterase